MRRREILGSWRFLTFSCYRQEKLLGNAKIRDAFAAALAGARERNRFRLIAWVIMPEHAHVIIVPRPVLGFERGWPLVASESTVDRIMWGLKKPFADMAIARWIELNAKVLERLRRPGGGYRFWQKGGGFDRNIRSDEKLWKAICYIHDNPVKQGLVERTAEWKWSSARWYEGEREGQIPIDNDWRGVRWEPPREWVEGAVRIPPERG